MHAASLAVTALVALLHAWFLVLEMFLWRRPLGRRVFGMDAQQAERTAVLAANQGLYNGFLVLGLAWSLAHPDPAVGGQLQRFFLGCVVVAGAFGAATVSWRIFVVQAVPALVGLALVALT